MAETTNIAWCHSTFNPWRGCSKVSAGCAHCYAETLSARNPDILGVWGPQGTRIVAAESQWREPLKWNRQYDAALRYWHERPYTPKPERPRVFCASLADVFEDWDGPMLDSQGRSLYPDFHDSPNDWTHVAHSGDKTPRLTMDMVRHRLFRLIDRTPHLDWLLLTKRPENVLRFAYDSWAKKVPGHVSQNEGDGRHWRFPRNLWLGTSCESQAAADARISHLLATPAAVRFLSCEPLLGPVDLTRLLYRGERVNPLDTANDMAAPHIDWCIIGGESGPGSRPCRVEWVRSLVRQCEAAGVACFVKQMGANVIDRNDAFGGWDERQWPESLDLDRVEDNIHGFREEYQGADVRVRLIDKKGGVPTEWPEDLRVRQFPEVAR